MLKCFNYGYKIEDAVKLNYYNIMTTGYLFFEQNQY